MAAKPCGKVNGPLFFRKATDLNGRSERIRTSDPLVPNEVRYQAALHSDIAGGFKAGELAL
jgi:hypothetical protein